MYLISRSHHDWTLVSNSVKAGGNFVVLDLNPATWYNLKVTAHNNAGFSVAEYEFATLTVTGGKNIRYDFVLNISISKNNLIIFDVQITATAAFNFDHPSGPRQTYYSYNTKQAICLFSMTFKCYSYRVL